MGDPAVRGSRRHIRVRTLADRPSQIDGVPFDIRGAELSHRGGRCTLEALISKYELRDNALRRLARIIRAADLPQEEPAPSEAAGVLAIFDGIRDGSQSDDKRLERGFTVRPT
jgi:hypothetical protein